MGASQNTNHISHVMKNLDAYIYASDFQTHEVLFINEKLKQVIGNAVGKLCWQAMPFEQNSPCKFCTDPKSLLIENDRFNQTVIKEFQNPATHEWFIVQEQSIPWSDGRLVRLKIMIDCHHLKKINDNKEKQFLSKEKQVGKIAHELRTPLNAILGYTQLMLYKKDYSHGSLEYINAIQHCGEQLLSLINDISSISKGKSDTSPDVDRSKNRFELFNTPQNIFQQNNNKPNALYPKNSRSGKVLVVDDSPDNRKFVMNTLDILGFRIKEASDGHQALEIWENWNPDLILLDIYMPEVNGHDVIQTIRNKELPGDHVFIIAISASSLEKDKDLAIESGCDDYLLKPFKLNTLIELIKKYMNVDDSQNSTQQSYKEKNIPNWLLDRIKQMPAKWLKQFKDAIEMLDPIQTKFYITKLEKNDLQAASVLMDWVKQFNFDRLQQLISEL
ncbi:MAG: response regulator [Candidatus Magnetomorum sp.]|nr:response regulator [Candidatus Magnetomorum sp.]